MRGYDRAVMSVMKLFTKLTLILMLAASGAMVLAQGGADPGERQRRRAEVREALQQQRQERDVQQPQPQNFSRQLSPQERAELRQQLRQQQNDPRSRIFFGQ